MEKLEVENVVVVLGVCLHQGWLIIDKYSLTRNSGREGVERRTVDVVVDECGVVREDDADVVILVDGYR